MVIQPSVVVSPLTLVLKSTLKQTHDASRTWGRIAVPRLQLPIEIRPGAVWVSGVSTRKQYRAELIAYRCCNALLDAGASDNHK